MGEMGEHWSRPLFRGRVGWEGAMDVRTTG